MVPNHLKLWLLFLSLFWVAAATSQTFAQGLNPNDEYIIISGGPALLKWESYRRDEQRHDKWWGNFVRAARLRIEELQKASQNTVKITWMVYKHGYVGRSTEDGEPLITHIESVRDKFQVNLVWYDSGDDIINYINSGKDRSSIKISGLEYFGHSNRFCFLLDYSNNGLGTSRAYLHQRELNRINKSAFAKKSYIKSWGCYSGESFCKEFRRVTGKKMIGAIGKTDYSDIWKGQLPVPSEGSRWVNE